MWRNGAPAPAGACRSFSKASTPTGPDHMGVANRDILALVNQERLRRILTRMLDEDEFLSPYGIRALSRYHLEHPYVFTFTGRNTGCSTSPPSRTAACSVATPTGGAPSGCPSMLSSSGLFCILPLLRRQFQDRVPHRLGEDDESLRGEPRRSPPPDPDLPAGRNRQAPVYGDREKFQTDPHWRDHILFYEYFHGDNGAGLGASHQTGWTGLVAKLIQLFGNVDSKRVLETDGGVVFVKPA